MANIVWTSTQKNFATNTAKITSNVTGANWMSFLDALGWMENNGKYGGLGGYHNAFKDKKYAPSALAERG